MQALYLVQQLLNALTPGCLYALLAVAYTLVYIIARRINLAFGELSTIGAYATLITVGLFMFGQAPTALILLSAACAALIAAALSGAAVERLVFRPLRATPSFAPLVASLGLLVFLQEYLRLLFGSDNYWLAQILKQPRTLLESAQFTVSVTDMQLAVIFLSAVMLVLLSYIMRSTFFGRCHRACAEDMQMAALCGVNVIHTVMRTFLLSAAYAGIGGFLVAVYYGVVNPYMGFVYGLKALTAAVLGGIGSVAGAMLGGFLIALLETLWTAYFAIEYRDVAVFSLLIIVLVLRPQGLLGYAGSEGFDNGRRQ